MRDPLRRPPAPPLPLPPEAASSAAGEEAPPTAPPPPAAEKELRASMRPPETRANKSPSNSVLLTPLSHTVRPAALSVAHHRTCSTRPVGCGAPALSAPESVPRRISGPTDEASDEEEPLRGPRPAWEEEDGPPAAVGEKGPPRRLARLPPDAIRADAACAASAKVNIETLLRDPPLPPPPPPPERGEDSGELAMPLFAASPSAEIARCSVWPKRPRRQR